jgi:hypothetical protein
MRANGKADGSAALDELRKMAQDLIGEGKLETADAAFFLERMKGLGGTQFFQAPRVEDGGMVDMEVSEERKRERFEKILQIFQEAGWAGDPTGETK